ncbi:MAG: hypothetical protein DSY33_01475 [Archaeoglobus sp.]|jgi:inner membrane protein involved in colicin E2 resistance|nr:MAG: hypothetical protein DSY33_01475 [Archaeoglobus sp.]
MPHSFQDEDLVRKCVFTLALSFGLGLILLLWAYGLYGISKTFKIFFYPQYVALIFALFYILFSILLEHRGAEVPYLFISGAIISALATFFVVCVVNGILWLRNRGLPDFNTALLEMSICSVVAFIMLKLITANNKA